jgi:hypothetical protein
VAASGIGAAVGGAAAERLGVVDPAGKHNNTVSNYGRLAAAQAAGTIASAVTRSLLDGSDFGDNILGGLAGVIGSTLGNMVVHGVSFPKRFDADSPMPGMATRPVEIAQNGGGLPDQPKTITIMGIEVPYQPGGTEVWEFRWAEGKFKEIWALKAKEMGFKPDDNDHFVEIVDDLFHEAYGRVLTERDMRNVQLYLEARLAGYGATTPSGQRLTLQYINSLPDNVKFVTDKPAAPVTYAPMVTTYGQAMLDHRTSYEHSAIGQTVQAVKDFSDGAISGDWKDRPGFAFGAGQFVGGFAPPADARDITAAGYHIYQGDRSVGSFVMLGGALFGGVPVIGDFGKFAIKRASKKFKWGSELVRAGDSAIGHLPELNRVGTRTIDNGAGLAVYTVDEVTGLTTRADGLIVGAHPGRTKGSIPDPVGGKILGEDRGHLIPENGVPDTSLVNVKENLISETTGSNRGMKQQLEKRSYALAAENPGKQLRFISEPLRRAGEVRPFAVSHYLTLDGNLVEAVTIFNR